MTTKIATKDVHSLKESGHRTTTSLIGELGIGPLSVDWIVRELGISPSYVTERPRGAYWSPEDVNKIRASLAQRLSGAAAQVPVRVLHLEASTPFDIGDWRLTSIEQMQEALESAIKHAAAEVIANSLRFSEGASATLPFISGRRQKDVLAISLRLSINATWPEGKPQPEFSFSFTDLIESAIGNADGSARTRKRLYTVASALVKLGTRIQDSLSQTGLRE